MQLVRRLKELIVCFVQNFYQALLTVSETRVIKDTATCVTVAADTCLCASFAVVLPGILDGVQGSDCSITCVVMPDITY